MTREPVATKGHYSTWLWRWVCDRPDCRGKDPVTAPKHRLPSAEDMQALGWFIARQWGDRCPTCVAAGHIPDVEPWGSSEPAAIAGQIRGGHKATKEEK